VNYDTLLTPYVTVVVQRDFTLPELQQHLFQRWTAFQHSMVLSVHFEHCCT